jgi:hypothetical protein
VSEPHDGSEFVSTGGATPEPPPAAPSEPVPSAETHRTTPEQRRELMARQVQNSIAQGARVQSQSEFQAVMVKGKPVNNTLHFFVGLFTFGVWWLVWIILAITGGEKREMITVDEFGNVAVQKL